MYATLDAAKQVDNLDARTKLYSMEKTKLENSTEQFTDIFSYVSYRIPEISDEVYRIDDALRAGFTEYGAFENRDAVG